MIEVAPANGNGPKEEHNANSPLSPIQCLLPMYQLDCHAAFDCGRSSRTAAAVPAESIYCLLIRLCNVVWCLQVWYIGFTVGCRQVILMILLLLLLLTLLLQAGALPKLSRRHELYGRAADRLEGVGWERKRERVGTV